MTQNDFVRPPSSGSAVPNRAGQIAFRFASVESGIQMTLELDGAEKSVTLFAHHPEANEIENAMIHLARAILHYPHSVNHTYL